MRKVRSKKALNIRAVPEDLYAQIKSQAKAEHRTLRKWVLNALETYLEVTSVEAKPRRNSGDSGEVPVPPTAQTGTLDPPPCPDDSTLMVWKDVGYFQCPDCGYVLQPIP